MKKRVLRYLKHLVATIAVLLIAGIIILRHENGSIGYGDNPSRLNLDKEGPYVFFENDSTLQVNYIRGNKTDGFFVEQKIHSVNSEISTECFFPLDSTSFKFNLKVDFQPPKSIYKDNQPILAISDIESSYKTFRDFLITNKVIDDQLKWTFEKGHLVLVGDFVDRGFSTKQVLWFIYKLEQDAKQKGGNVHFILGNHELKNMEGKYEAASPKYYGVAAILGKHHDDLYSRDTFIGKWMSSKNTIERINGVLFTHGGIHPDIANHEITLDNLNRINRNNYYKSFYPKPEKNIEQLVLSSKNGICWYRGYFKDDLSQEDVEKGIQKFDANAIVVGHTIQSRVKKHYNGKVFAIDVKHPNDYYKNWPRQKSEALLITQGKFFRLLSNGNKIAL